MAIAIINRRKYNTEASTVVASYNNGISGIRWIKETLYRTKKAYFIYGEGGAATRYAEPLGNNTTTGGSKITVLSRDQAIAWLEEHRCTDALEAEFGEDIQDG